MANSIENNREHETLLLKIETSGENETSVAPIAQISSLATQENEKEHTSLAETDVKFRQKQFDKLLTEAVDEAITTLGAPIKNTLYQHLEVDFCMPIEQIPRRIEEFDEVIHKIFGMGAIRLEIKFMKNLNSKIQADTTWPECEWPMSKWMVTGISFVDYITKIRKDFETNCTEKH
jgi:hypothetical protein